MVGTVQALGYLRSLLTRASVHCNTCHAWPCLRICVRRPKEWASEMQRKSSPRSAEPRGQPSPNFNDKDVRRDTVKAKPVFRRDGDPSGDFKLPARSRSSLWRRVIRHRARTMRIFSQEVHFLSSRNAQCTATASRASRRHSRSRGALSRLHVTLPFAFTQSPSRRLCLLRLFPRGQSANNSTFPLIRSVVVSQTGAWRPDDSG